MATKVKLRKKAISGNRQSLYLDFYPPIPHPETGKPTRREFLQIYIAAQPKTPADKAHNKETLLLAEQIRQRKENLLNKPEVYTGYELEQLRIKEQGERNFVEYFRQLANKRKASNYDNWVSALHYFQEFTGGILKFSEVTELMCTEFREYLETTPTRKSEKYTLAQNSIVSYFNKLRAVLKQAYKDNLLQSDISRKIDGPQTAETHISYLNIDEVVMLANTICPIPVLKQAALFSTLTGLRFSDIQKLTWGELEKLPEHKYILHFKQKKTGGVEYHYISEQAYELMGEPGAPDKLVFEGLKYSAQLNTILRNWVQSAGITKKITFHCFRHTYATLQLNSGTNFYVVSQLLGHKNPRTTQRYAKVTDESRKAAAEVVTFSISKMATTTINI